MAGSKRFSLSAASALVAVCFVLMFLPGSAALAQCPPEEKLLEGFQKLFQRKPKILKVHASPVAGLCEVQVNMDGRNGVLYSNTTGDYFLTGQLLDVEHARNLTQETMMELNRFTLDEMKRLETLTAFTSGKSEKFLYFVTDPQCPYCKKGHEILQKLADEGILSVRFLLYPLPMHPTADQQSIAIICDNKGAEGLMQGYSSENQCPEGVSKINETASFMKSKGISGTPAYIFPDGIYHVGLMQEEELRKRFEPASKGSLKPGPDKKP